LRILTVSHFFEGHGGGIERVAGELCRQFSRLGEGAVWAASDSDAPPTGNIEGVALGCVNPTERLTGLPMPIPGMRGIRTLAREVRRSDAVIIHDALYATSIIAMLIAKISRKRTILIQHIAAIPFSSPVLRKLMRAANFLVTGPMLRAADESVFISDVVRKELVGIHGSKSSHLLFNGVDGAVFHRAGGSAPTLPSIASTGTLAGRRLLFVGRYVEKKGLNVLRALAKLRPDLSFFLVGTGNIRPSDWKLANVHDLGPQTQEALAALYRWAELLVLPSVGEGYPLVIQEAMACGLPVVCGAPCDQADPDAAQWLRGVGIDLADPEASARRCSEAIDNVDSSSDQKAAMAEYARQRYDWGSTAEKLIDLAKRSTGGNAS